jgi:hypothetical protein
MTTDTFDEDAFIARVSSLTVQLNNAQIFSSGYSLAEGGTAQLNQQAVDNAVEQAESELEKQAAKKAVCAALESTGDDLTDIAKVVAAALLPLVASGVIILSLTPLAFATAALVVYKTGVSAYCSDLDRQEGKE